MKQTLSKILNDPLFKDVDDFNRKILRKKRSAPQLDEKIIAALARSPEALKLVLDFLKKEEETKKRANPFQRTQRRRNPPKKLPPPPPFFNFFKART